MRINKFVAQATELSRRAVDQAIEQGEVSVNGQPATLGQQISETDKVTFQGKPLSQASALNPQPSTIMLNKPVGYVVSRDGQGSRTIYELLPPEFQSLKPVGRLDKDSSGLLLLTNDGQLAQELTHPKYAKEKVYEVTLDKPLTDRAKTKLDTGVILDDGPSHLTVIPTAVEGSLNQQDLSTPPPAGGSAQDNSSRSYEIRMHEGRNRQIRRTFAAVGYKVIKLHRTHFGDHKLSDLKSGSYLVIPAKAGI